MRYIDSKSIGAISSVGTAGLASSLVVGSGMFSMLFGAGKSKGLSRAQRKKLSRRRRRRFVDNIVMHHKRQHDRNREISINLVKSRIVKKKKIKEKIKLAKIAKSPQLKWKDRFDSKDRTLSMRERVKARRLRAQSRWLSTISKSHGFDNIPKVPPNFDQPPDMPSRPALTLEPTIHDDMGDY